MQFLCALRALRYTVLLSARMDLKALATSEAGVGYEVPARGLSLRSGWLPITCVSSQSHPMIPFSFADHLKAPNAPAQARGHGATRKATRVHASPGAGG